MTRRPVVRAIAVACWGIALVPGVGSAFGQEATASPTLDGLGWWNKSQALPAPVEGAPSALPGAPVTKVTVPPPPNAPEEGLYVANEASGAAAISAVRFLGGGTDGGQLTLRLAGDAPATGTEELAACPLPGGFTPVQNGRWDAKPAFEEATCTVAGTFAEDGKAVTFALDATFVSTLGDLQAVIVPKPGSTAPFTLGFEKPANDALVPAGAPAGGTSSEFTPIDSGSSSLDTGGSTFSSPTDAGSFDAPASAVADTPATPPAAAPVQEVAAAPAKAITESRTARGVAVGLLLAIGAAFWWLASQPERAPRLLGSVGGAAKAAAAVPVPAAVSTRARGVGRFARPRTQPPTPIS